MFAVGRAFGAVRVRRAAIGCWVAAVALVGGGCTSPSAAAFNLRELHDFDGSTRRVGRVQSHSEFLIRSSVGGALAAFGDSTARGPAAKPPRQIARPLDRTLEELLILASFDPEAPAVAGLQVELCAWLAVSDPYVLSRERCVMELGRHALRLGVERPVQLAADVPAAGPDEVRDAIHALWAATERGGEAAVDEAVAALDALVLDLDGNRRALAATNLVLARRDTGAARVLDAHRRFQVRTTELALGAALVDDDGLVRATALRASAELSESARESLLRAWAAEEGEPYDRAPEVLHAVADLLAYGVPDGDARERWLDRLYLIAEDPYGPASVAACRALAALMPSAEPSLRAEDWLMRLREPGADADPEGLAPAAGERARS